MVLWTQHLRSKQAVLHLWIPPKKIGETRDQGSSIPVSSMYVVKKQTDDDTDNDKYYDHKQDCNDYDEVLVIV